MLIGNKQITIVFLCVCVSYRIRLWFPPTKVGENEIKSN